MRWSVEWRRRALADLAALEPRTRRRVVDSIERMAADRRRDDLKKLQGRNDEWRMRVGDWRVRLNLNYSDNILTVLRVRHRREVYRER